MEQGASSPNTHRMRAALNTTIHKYNSLLQGLDGLPKPPAALSLQQQEEHCDVDADWSEDDDDMTSNGRDEIVSVDPQGTHF
jgi:hypothetical protein